MRKLFSVSVAVLLIAGLSACGGARFTDTSEPKGPSGFYNYAEQLGKQTDGFNPCNNGIKESQTDFGANTSAQASREDGLNVDLQAYARKGGKCN